MMLATIGRLDRVTVSTFHRLAETFGQEAALIGPKPAHDTSYFDGLPDVLAGAVVSASGGMVPGSDAPGSGLAGPEVPGVDPGDALVAPGVAVGSPVPVSGVQAARPPITPRASSTEMNCLRMPGLLKFFPFYRRPIRPSGTGR